MKIYTYILFSFFVFLNICSVQAQRNPLFLDYIQTYGKLAVSHMEKYKIPASIKLAQGILESGAGKSSFVLKSNNHFGIKCHLNWKGDRIYYADDGPNDCFRSYSNVEESFEDHSRFLTGKERYTALFDLDIKDYRSWATGLQKCGYATDKAYANKLIKVIEDYKLYRFDNKEEAEKLLKNTNKLFTLHRISYKDHGLIYIIADKNDSYEKIAQDIGCDVETLIKYNEVPENFPVYAGDIIYLKKKKKHANKPYFEHEVQIGESMHKISQIYGMQVKRLYKLNKKDFDYIPVEGDILRLQ
jgi:LysM repeat protein